MANKTINDLTVTTSAASGDFVPVWRASNGDTRKITKANFMGGVLTGAGTIATGGFTLTLSSSGTLALAGFSLTVGANSTVNGSLVGNMTGSGTVATGGFTLTVGANSTINGSVVGSMTGAGTIATGGFTLTVPATGTAALLGTAQTFSALNTFSSGINLGNTNFTTYIEGSWTPGVAFGGNTVGMSVTSNTGRYTRIGNRIDAWGVLTLTTKGSSTGVTTITGLPVAASTITGLDYPAQIFHYQLNHVGAVSGLVRSSMSAAELWNDNDGTLAAITDTAFTNGDQLWIHATYRVGT